MHIWLNNWWLDCNCCVVKDLHLLNENNKVHGTVRSIASARASGRIMPWLKPLDVSVYNKIHHDEEGKQFGKNRFLQIATLKLIIQLYFLVIQGIFVGVFSPHFLHSVNSQGANSWCSPSLLPFTACLLRQPRLRLSAVSRYVLSSRGAAFNLIVFDLISSPPDWIKLNCTAWLQHAADKCNTDGSDNFQKYSGDPFFGGAQSIKSWNRKAFFFLFHRCCQSSRLSSLCVVTLNELDGYIPYCPGLIFPSSKTCFHQQIEANYVEWTVWRSPVCLKSTAVQMLMRSNL